ncbi:MAG TPA: His/Gly/Thr/Pro-type tRNA ligase C-terminal domain-containing protein [Candidatus Wunengus californicus]|uniref:His/Gly/Thr/Pro-type tRNA ligase C-terminal domain-containing protein n=1 Tax=Candidatus Wunengus californicus TaxID=3367619 RepID=UPI004027C88B
MTVKLQIPRKTNLGYFSLSVLRRAGYIEWDDKLGRSYSIVKGDYEIQQAREIDIPENVMSGISDAGITRQSYVAELTGKWPNAGDIIDDLYVVDAFDFCPNLISPLATKKPILSRKRVIVPPSLEKTCKILYGGLDDLETSLLVSVHSGLLLGYGFMGIGRVSPLTEADFIGDVGKESWPYERLKSFGIRSFSRSDLEGMESRVPTFSDRPILIRNVNSGGNVADELLRGFSLSARLTDNRTDVFDYVKENGKYVSKAVRVKSADESSLADIGSDAQNFCLFYRNRVAKLFNPGSVVQVNYKVKADGVIDFLPEGFTKIEDAGTNSAMKRAVRRVVRSQAEYLIIIGEDEVRNGAVTLKELATNSQITCAPKDVAKRVMSPVNPENVLLVQEQGVPEFGRRLSGHGEIYAQTRPDLIKIYSGHRDMVKLMVGGFASEAVMGYDTFIEGLFSYYKFDSIPSIEEFNSFAKKHGIPFRIELLGGSRCNLALAIPDGPGYSSDIVVSEFPDMAEHFLQKLSYPAKVRRIAGAAEIYPYPIIDIVSTGETLRRNGKELSKNLLELDAIVVKRAI